MAFDILTMLCSSLAFGWFMGNLQLAIRNDHVQMPDDLVE